MKAISTDPEMFESTYALLVRSEEKQRSRFETLVYSVLIATTVLAVSQFGSQTIKMSVPTARTSSIVSVAAPHRV